MSTNETDYTYNSNSNEDELGINPSLLPSDTITSTISTHRPPPPPPGFLKMSKDDPENDNKAVELVSDDSELGIDLGRRLARLELGNELNKEQMEQIKKRCEIKEEMFVMGKPLSCHSRIDELEEKVVSMETRLSAQEKQGFDMKEKIENLEKNLKKKDNEITVLRDILANQMTERKKDEHRICKQEQASRQLSSQFHTLIDTCKTFNEDIQSLKKTNFEMKRELKKKENIRAPTKNATIPGQGSYPTQGNQKSAHDFSPPCISDFQKMSEQHPSVSMVAPSARDVRTKPISMAPMNQPNVYQGQEFIPQGNYYHQGTSGPMYYQVNPHIPQPNFVFRSEPPMQGTGPDLQTIQAIQSKYNSNYNSYH